MRDAIELQRRRRLMMMLNRDSQSSGSIDAAAKASAWEKVTSQSAKSSDTARETPRQQMLRECLGCAETHVVIEVAGEAHPRRISLGQPYLLIGSDPDCDVDIRHTGVAPRHACLQWIDGHVYGFALAASSDQTAPAGSWIGSQPVTMGPIRISIPEFDVESVITDPQARSSELAAEFPQIQLKFNGVEQEDNLWPVDRRMTLIGRSPGCRLRLDHPQIPDFLASLIRTPSGCWLIDLSRRRQVRVNDTSQRLHSLDIGDSVQMGPFLAEVGTAPISLKGSRPKNEIEPVPSAVRQLATEHRQRLTTLNKSLAAVQVFLDSEHVSSVPALKKALEDYISRAQDHHSQIQKALERLADPSDVATSRE